MTAPQTSQCLDQHRHVSRSFLVHLRTDADLAAGRIVGRVEHVHSGDAAHFQSIEELISFMAALLDPGLHA